MTDNTEDLDPYVILGVERTATEGDIKSACIHCLALTAWLCSEATLIFSKEDSVA
jgi:hypothetical protein